MRSFGIKRRYLPLVAAAALLAQSSALAQPGGREGPPILVPTDVIGGHGFDAPKIETLPSAKTIRFHDKADAKKYLLETVSDTTYTKGDGQLTVERGVLLVAPHDGHLIVHTPGVDVSVPRGTVALIGCTADGARVFNLSGHSVIVRVLKLEDPNAHGMDSVALDAGIGYSDYGDKTTFAGTHALDSKSMSENISGLQKLKNFQLVSFDPMVVLQKEAITKQLTKDWMHTMSRVEKTSEELSVVRGE